MLEVKDLDHRRAAPRPDRRTSSAAASGAPTARDLYYCTVDEAWRRDKVWRHRLGTDQADDELVFHETDERFWVGVGRSRTDRFLVIASRLQEHHRVPLPRRRRPRRGLGRCSHPREEGLEYGLEHAVIGGEDVFLVLHNHTGADFEIGTAPIAATPPSRRGRR